MTQIQSDMPVRDRRGFTLVELMVAIMILTVGMLGLAGTAAMVARQMGGGRSMTIASNVAYSRFERMTSSACGTLANGTATTRGIGEQWVVAPRGNNVFSVRDSVWYQTTRGQRSHVFESMVECL